MRRALRSLRSLRASLWLWIAALCLALGSLAGLASAPAWWGQRGLLRVDPETGQRAEADDYAVATQGQLKNFALQAFKEFTEVYPGEVGAELTSSIDRWTICDADGNRSPKVTPATDDYAVVNIGQLKNTAKPFYDQLAKIGLAAGYPLYFVEKPADDHAVVNLGQLKNMFSIDFRVDSDHDGMPDLWELARHLNPNDANDASADPDFDGFNNLDEYLNGTDPAHADRDDIIIHLPFRISITRASHVLRVVNPPGTNLLPITLHPSTDDLANGYIEGEADCYRYLPLVVVDTFNSEWAATSPWPDGRADLSSWIYVTALPGLAAALQYDPNNAGELAVGLSWQPTSEGIENGYLVNGIAVDTTMGLNCVVSGVGSGLASFTVDGTNHGTVVASAKISITVPNLSQVNAAAGGLGAFNLDSDGDGLSDGLEELIGSDPGNPDTNGDHISDGAAVAAGRSPLSTSLPPLAEDSTIGFPSPPNLNILPDETRITGGVCPYTLRFQKIRLQWSAPAGPLSGYRVERSFTGESWEDIQDLKVTEFTDRHLGSYNTIYYRVRARRGNHVSVASLERSVMIAHPGADGEADVRPQTEPLPDPPTSWVQLGGGSSWKIRADEINACNPYVPNPMWQHVFGFQVALERGVGSLAASWAPNGNPDSVGYSLGVGLDGGFLFPDPPPVTERYEAGRYYPPKVLIDALYSSGVPATRDDEGKRHLVVGVRPALPANATPPEIASALANAPRVNISITPSSMPSGVATVVIPSGCQAYLDDDTRLIDPSVDFEAPAGQLTPLKSGSLSLRLLATPGAPGGELAVNFRGQSESINLLPVDIKVGSFLNKSPGKLITTASAVCVGEPITLSIDKPELVTSYNWHVPGGIKTYTAAAAAAHVTPLSAADTSASSITFYYPIRPESGRYDVSCDVTLATGGTVTITGSLTVVAPTASVVRSIRTPSIERLSRATGVIRLGRNDIPGLEGFNFAYTDFKMPSGFSWEKIEWWQTVDAHVNGTAVDKRTSGLDTRFPYDTTLRSSDSPFSTVYPKYSPVTRSDSFTTYLMFRPNVPGSIFVPVKQIDWWWGGTATYTPHPPSLQIDGQWDGSGKFSDATQAYPSTAEPEWNHLATKEELDLTP